MSASSEDVSIQIFDLGRLGGGKDPLVEELRRIDPDLDYEEGFGGGGGPLPLDYVLAFVTIAAAGQYMKGFLSAAGAAHYQALHECISRLINKITREEEEALKEVGEEELEELEIEGELPETAPLSISMGRVHFYFQGKPTPKQVAERLLKAQEIVDSLPDHDLRVEMQNENEARRRPRNFVWDDDTGRWIEKGPRSSSSAW